MGEHIRCGKCLQYIVFKSQVLTGLMGMTCGCGTHLVPRIAPPPSARRQRLDAMEERLCAWCVKPFMASRKRHGRFCSTNCRHNETYDRRKRMRDGNKKGGEKGGKRVRVVA